VGVATGRFGLTPMSGEGATRHDPEVASSATTPAIMARPMAATKYSVRECRPLGFRRFATTAL
jgi:hypothetical protein